jgi:hypothetical protein
MCVAAHVSYHYFFTILFQIYKKFFKESPAFKEVTAKRPSVSTIVNSAPLCAVNPEEINSSEPVDIWTRGWLDCDTACSLWH